MLLVASGAAVGCGDAAGPDDAFDGGESVAGTWALKSIGDRQLPILESSGGHGSNTIVADTLVLAPDGTASSATYMYTVFSSPGLPSRNDTTAIRSAGTWTQRGAVVDFVWQLPTTSGSVVQTATHAAAGQIASVGGIGYRFGPSADAVGRQPVYSWVQAR